MLKIWKAIANNGGWNGFNTLFAIAETSAEASKKMSLRTYRDCGSDVYGPYEAQTEDFLNMMHIFDKEKYNISITYTITPKENAK